MWLAKIDIAHGVDLGLVVKFAMWKSNKNDKNIWHIFAKNTQEMEEPKNLTRKNHEKGK